MDTSVGAGLHPEIVEVVRRALEEDIGPGDITSRACVPEDRRASGFFLVRERLVLASVELLPLIYGFRGGVDKLEILQPDGARLNGGQHIATVEGRARTLLECERVALNFLQRLSGVATLARQFE